MPRPKTLIIGLDGATFDVIDPLVREGVLPTIGRLKASGVSAPLTSVYPPVTGPAWVSLATGKNPGKTGVFDFLNRREVGGRFQSITSSVLAGSAFWDLLSARGLRVGIFNYPMLYPAYPINGFMVGGLGSPVNERLAWPSGLLAELHRRAGGFEPELTLYNDPIYTDNEDLFVAHLLRGFGKRVDVLRHLLDSRDWDVFVTVLSASDFIQHYLWKHWDASHPQHDPARSPRYRAEFQRLWGLLDGIVAELCRGLSGDATVMLVSDHGFGPIDRCFYLNAWLGRQGYLRGRRLWMLLEDTLEPLVRRAAPPLYTAGKRFLKGRLGITRPRAEQKIATGRSRVFSLGANRLVGSIFLGAGGADGAGLREELADALQALGADPEVGIELEVRRPEELYRGERLPLGPDLMVNVKGFRGAVDSRAVSGPVAAALARGGRGATWVRNVTGHHRMDGIFIAAGPMIRPGTLPAADIVDVAPTLLFGLGFTAPADMDGRVLDIFRPEHAAAAPLLPAASGGEGPGPDYQRTREEEELMKDTLQGLGYL